MPAVALAKAGGLARGGLYQFTGEQIGVLHKKWFLFSIHQNTSVLKYFFV
jgi:hypothetical protein